MVSVGTCEAVEASLGGVDRSDNPRSDVDGELVDESEDIAC